MTTYLLESDHHESAWSTLRSCDLPENVWKRATRLVYEADTMGVPSNVFIDHDGAASVTFYDDDLCLEVVIEPGGPMSYMVKKGYGFEFKVLDEKEDASEGHALKWVHTLSGKSPWSSSGLFVLAGGTTGRAVSTTWRLGVHPAPTRTRPMVTGASPSLMRIAPSEMTRKGKLYADT